MMLAEFWLNREHHCRTSIQRGSLIQWSIGGIRPKLPTILRLQAKKTIIDESREAVERPGMLEDPKSYCTF